MVSLDLGWQGIVSGVWVTSWNDRMEGGWVLIDLRCGELDLGIGRSAQVIVHDLLFVRFFIVLGYFQEQMFTSIGFPSSSRGTSL